MPTGSCGLGLSAVSSRFASLFMKRFEEYFSDKAIIERLCRIRLKQAFRRHDRLFYRQFSSEVPMIEIDKCEAFKNVERWSLRLGKTGAKPFSRSTFLSDIAKASESFQPCNKFRVLPPAGGPAFGRQWLGLFQGFAFSV